MDKTGLILSIAGTSLPVGSLFLWIARKIAGAAIAKAKEVMGEMASLRTDMEKVRMELGQTRTESLLLRESVKDHSTQLRHTDAQLANCTTRITTVERACDRLGDLLLKVVGLQSEIGRMSQYYKGQKSGNEGK